MTDEAKPVCGWCLSASSQTPCLRCEEKIFAVMKNVRVLNPTRHAPSPNEHGWDGADAMKLYNASFSTNIEGAPAVIAIDGRGAPGVQKPIAVDGQVKCIVCDEWSEFHLICEECRTAVNFARSIKHFSNWEETLEILEREEVVALLKFVSSNAVRRYLEDEIGRFGEA